MNLNKFIAKRNNIVFYTSNDIGVKPILSKINEDMNFYKNADMCPLEKSVIHIEDPVAAKIALENTIKELMNLKKAKSK